MSIDPKKDQEVWHDIVSLIRFHDLSPADVTYLGLALIQVATIEDHESEPRAMLQ